MTSFHSGRLDQADPTSGAAAASSGVPDEILAPVMAGAHARGVAETLDMLGIPGVFLGRAGEVLLATHAAAPLLQGPLRLHMRHLVAERAEDNRVLEAFIADAVGDARAAHAVRLPGAAFELRRLPRTEAATLPGQMVRAVVLLADATDARHAALLRLLA